MKLAILGGGGFRVPLVYQALTTGQTESGKLIDEAKTSVTCKLEGICACTT